MKLLEVKISTDTLADRKIHPEIWRVAENMPQRKLLAVFNSNPLPRESNPRMLRNFFAPHWRVPRVPSVVAFSNPLPVKRC